MCYTERFRADLNYSKWGHISCVSVSTAEMKLQSRKKLLFSQEASPQRKAACKWSLWCSSGQYFKNVSLMFLYISEFSRALSMYLAVSQKWWKQTSNSKGCILSWTQWTVFSPGTTIQRACPVDSAPLYRVLRGSWDKALARGHVYV